MSMLTKNLIAGAIVGSLALTGAVIADEDIKHKRIDIKAVKGEDVNVLIDTNGSAQTFTFSEAELADNELLENKLVDLDDETRKTLRQALKSISGNHPFEEAKLIHGGDHKVIVVNKGDGQLMQMSENNDVNIEFDDNNGGKHVMLKHIVIEDDNNEILQGQTDAIAKLIERGEFSQQELDKIQAALDAKR